MNISPTTGEWERPPRRIPKPMPAAKAAPSIWRGVFAALIVTAIIAGAAYYYFCIRHGSVGRIGSAGRIEVRISE